MDLDGTAALLMRDTDAALSRASQQYAIAGFAFVFEVGQPKPCFDLAIDTGPSPASPSTGEWTYPAGGFAGAEMSAEWRDRYELLSAYMAEDDKFESRLCEVHAFLRFVMRRVRYKWSKRLPMCVFTVNECNDSVEAVKTAYIEINRDS